ncbi:MAG: NADH-quinone oxidoreductase subunit H [Candidatus Omnitrophica bacterium]|nr:NADH-quinone oxidoreductase subunit H [Candidatus Omnitrophota bacterium]
MKIIQIILILVLSPFLSGVINRTKAFFCGRKGSPIFQLYYDIYKLLLKGAVYSSTITWVFIAGPIVSLSAIILAAFLIPFGGEVSLISFNGDIILFIYLLGLGRFFTVLAALDTGSSFEGMGASREVQFAVFAEPALFLSVAALVRLTGKISLSEIFDTINNSCWAEYSPVIFLVLGAIFIVFLTENSRIPVDDPNTHLELTMVHEVMVLDHCGVDLAYICYGSAVKFWILGSFIVSIILKTKHIGWGADQLIFILAMTVLAFIVGLAESFLPRLRLLKVPHLLIVALALSILALTLTFRGFK